MPNPFEDRVVQYPKRFTLQADGADGTVNDPALNGKVVALAVAPGTVTKAGTPLDAEEMNARDSFDKIIDLTYVSAGLFSTTLTGYDFIDDDKLTFRFIGTVPDADLELEAEVSVDGGTTTYPLVLKDSGNVILVGKLINPIQVADVYKDGTDVIINRSKAADSEEQEYDLPIQSQQTIVPVESSPFGDNKIEGESAIQELPNGNFDDGTINPFIATNIGVPVVASEIVSFTATAQYGSLHIVPGTIIGQKYMTIARFKASSSNVLLAFGASSAAHSGSGKFEIKSFIHTATTVSHDLAIADYNASGWAQVEVDYLMSIPLLSVKQLAMTATDLAKKYPVYFESLKSVENPEIKVGNINLAEIQNDGFTEVASVTSYKILERGIELTTVANGGIRKEFSVKPNTDYYINYDLTGAGAIRIYDDDALTTLLAGSQGTFNTGDNKTITMYVRNIGAVTSIYDNIQLSEGTTPIAYKQPDNSSKKYPLQTLRGVTDGSTDVVDYIDTENNVLHKLTDLDETIVKATTSWSITDILTTNQSFYKDLSSLLNYKLPSTNSLKAKAKLIIGNTIFTLIDRISQQTADISNSFAIDITSNLIITVNKTTYPNSAAFEAYLAANDVKFQFELNDEIITEDIDVDGIAFAYKNMTIELIQDNGFGFSVFAKHDLNYEASVQSLGKALQTAMKEITVLEEDVALNNTHRASDGTDHADVVDNTAEILKRVSFVNLISSPILIDVATTRPSSNITLSETLANFDEIKLEFYTTANPTVRIYVNCEIVQNAKQIAINFSSPFVSDIATQQLNYTFYLYRDSATTLTAYYAKLLILTLATPAYVVSAMSSLYINRIIGIKH